MRIKGIPVKRLQRTFALRNELNYKCVSEWADEVVSRIEKKTLKVFDPEDDKALDYWQDKDGALLPLKRARHSVSICEWLPVGCQCIRWGECSSPTAWGTYENNLHRVVCPPDRQYIPQGPRAFVGEIVIANRLRREWVGRTHTQTENAFKFLVAHELVHVFDCLRYLVPAMKNWQAFWHHVLGEGGFSDVLLSNWDCATFVDHYGTDIELGAVAEYWPSQADKWFEGFERWARAFKRKQKGKGTQP